MPTTEKWSKCEWPLYMLRPPLFCYVRPDEGSSFWRLVAKLLCGMDSFAGRLRWPGLRVVAWHLFAAWRTPLIEKRQLQEVQATYQITVNCG